MRHQPWCEPDSCQSGLNKMSSSSLSQTELNLQLLDFLSASPTPFHAVANMAQRFDQAGFIALDETKNWDLQAGQGYYLQRSQSAIIAFIMGDNLHQGWHLIGAHTDSPCLKVKPNPELHSQGYFQLGVEVYGGALLHPWFDRDLGLAGRVFYQSQNRLQSALIDFARPIAIIPSLAIHLDREANNNHSINSQRDLPPILLQSECKLDFRALLLDQTQQQYPNQPIERVMDYELCFYDYQQPSVLGLNQDFIAGARLDNLLSCFIGMMSLLQAPMTLQHSCLLVCTDHEEVGSQSVCGAQGPFLKALLQRIYPNPEDFYRVLSQSWLVSADNAHGIHPNFADRHDSQHGPLLNKGPVLKINANQRYATTGETSAIFRQISQRLGIPLQTFVIRTDMACGSTIGPITAATLGVNTVDIGVPTFAMHSIRELAGSQDAYYLYQILKYFYRESDLLAF